MFEQTFVQSQTRTRNPWTVAASLSLQCLAVALLLLIPLLHPEALHMPALPQPRLISTWVNLQTPPPQPTSTRTATSSPAMPSRIFVYVPPSHATGAAERLEVPTGDLEPATWAEQSTTGFAMKLGIGDTLPPSVAVQPKPAAHVEPKSVPNGPLKVSLGVQGAKLIFGPRPAYPSLAIATHSQGVVKLEAYISAEGSIRNLRVVSGPPLLVNAALDAVRQWRYQPTLLNGTAVEVITEIDVNFTLAR